MTSTGHLSVPSKKLAIHDIGRYDASHWPEFRGFENRSPLAIVATALTESVKPEEPLCY